MVEFTDAFQSIFELAVVAQPQPDHGFLFGTKAELLGAATWITDGQYPNGAALSRGADRTAGAVADEPVEQRAAEDLGGGGQSLDQLGAFAGDCILLHL